MKFIHALIWVLTAALLWACVATSFAASFSDQIANRRSGGDPAPTKQIAPPAIQQIA